MYSGRQKYLIRHCNYCSNKIHIYLADLLIYSGREAKFTRIIILDAKFAQLNLPSTQHHRYIPEMHYYLVL
jgi:hypothetical protein